MKKKVLTALFLLMLLAQASNARDNNVDVSYQGYSDYPQNVSAYYTNGVKLLDAHKYTDAIVEFRKALRENPADKSSKIQLINAYILRAQYYNNQAKDYNRAANDLRSAIFYMKYYENAPVESQYTNNLHTMEKNLDSILYAINADKTPKGRYAMGKSLRAQGEFAAAVVEFQETLYDKSYRKSSLANLGEIYNLLNLNEQAVNYLSQAVHIDEKNANLQLKLAVSYEKLGQVDKALEHYNAALSGDGDKQEILMALENIWKQKIIQNPKDAEAYANLGAVYQKKNDFTSALSYYEKAELLNPSNITTRLNLGTLYQAKKEYQTAIEAYNTIIAFNPNFLQAYLYKAQCYKAMNDKESALKNYQLALNLDPTSQEIKEEIFKLKESSMTQDEKLAFLLKNLEKEPNNSDLAYRYAFELHKSGNLNEAIQYYKQVIKLDANNENAHINLAQALQQQSNFDEARMVLNNAKNLFPENQFIKKQLASIAAETSSILYSKASELFTQKKYQEAIALYKKISPETPEALVGIGACYQSLNDNATAAEYYAKSFGIDGKNSDTAYYAALAYSNVENFTKAKSFANKALGIEPQNKNAKELLAYVIEQENTINMDKAMDFYDKKQYSQALALLNTVVAQDPSDSNAYYYRAMVYDAQKQYKSAIEDYKKALIHNPQMLIANYSIAVDYDNLKQYANALSYHKKYLEETKKIGETNDYTRYSAARIQDLKKYETTTTPAAAKSTGTTKPAINVKTNN